MIAVGSLGPSRPPLGGSVGWPAPSRSMGWIVVLVLLLLILPSISPISGTIRPVAAPPVRDHPVAPSAPNDPGSGLLAQARASLAAGRDGNAANPLSSCTPVRAHLASGCPLARPLVHPATNATNANWTNVTARSALLPPPLAGAAMTYDVADGYVVLFGGRFASRVWTDSNQTWKFSLGNWTNLSSTAGTPPTARADTSMAYDGADGYVLLFGGDDARAITHRDSWSFVHGRWTALHIAGAPPPALLAAGLAYDATHREMVLYGGWTENPLVVYRNETWTYSNATWTNLTGNLTRAPPASDDSPIVFDAADGYILLALATPFASYRSTGFWSTNTWKFQNHTWTNLTTSLDQAPAYRFRAAFVFDPSVHAAMVFGGAVGQVDQESNETWFYAAQTWVQVPNSTASGGMTGPPNGRSQAAMAYDNASGCVLLFGGVPNGYVNGTNRHLLQDTWTFCASSINWTQTGNHSGNNRSGGNGPPVRNATWTNQTANSTLAPPIRADGGMAYDARDGYVVYFGGADFSHDVNETWSYANGTWTNRTSTLSTAPPAREGAAMAYDAADGYVVLFGGNSITRGFLADTWTFSGGVWTNLTGNLSTAPPGRFWAATTYDTADGYLLMFGGRTGNGLASDTWKFAGGQWTDLSSTIPRSPSSDCCAGLIDDPLDGYVVLPPSPFVNQTWTYHAGAWTNRTTPTGPSPSPRWNPMTAADAAAGGALLFGGQIPGAPWSSSPLGDTWLFHGGNWTLLISTPGPVATSPSPRFSGSMVYVNSSKCALLFGGWLGVPGVSSNQTWTFCGTNLTRGTNASGSGAGNGSGGNGTHHLAPPLAASLTVTPTSGRPPVTASATVNVSGGQAPYRLTVCFGALPCNGTTGWSGSGSFIARANLAGPGNYSVIAEATDALGTSARTTGQVSLRDVAALLVHAESTQTSPGSGSSVLFRATVAGGVTPYTIQWQFGDGSQGSSVSGAQVSHTYGSPGDYFPVLLVRDAANDQSRTPLPLVHVALVSISPNSKGPPSDNALLLSVILLVGVVAGVGGLFALRWAIRERRFRREARELAAAMFAYAHDRDVEEPVSPPGPPPRRDP